MLAAGNGYTEIVKLLKNNGATVDPALFLTRVKAGDTEAVKAYIAAGVDVNARDSDGDTVLMNAALPGHTEIVRLLLGVSGIEKSATNSDGDTALMLAAAEGHTTIVTLLEPTAAEKRAATTKLVNAVWGNNLSQVNEALAGGGECRSQEVDPLDGFKVGRLLWPHGHR